MKIAALSLLAFAFVGVNAHGADRCTWGPTYWCKSIIEAKECNAVQHCINHNWAQLALTKNAGHACEICKLVVTDVRDIFSPEFEKDIEDAWAQICAVIPIALIISKSSGRYSVPIVSHSCLIE